MKRARRDWTEQELENLRKWQAEKVPTKEQADRFDRPVGSVRDKLRQLKINSGKSGPPFTPEEVKLIREWTKAKVPHKVQAKRLGRSRHAIRGKIRKLGIAPEVVCRPWTDEEVELLREWKAKKVAILTQARRLNRTLAQVRSKLTRLNMRSKKWGRVWTAKEKELVREWQEQGVPGKEQARRLKRSYPSWSQGVARYKLQGQHSKYNPDLRVQVMALVVQRKTQTEIMEAMGKSRASVGVILRELQKKGLIQKEKRCGPYSPTREWTGP